MTTSELQQLLSHISMKNTCFDFDWVYKIETLDDDRGFLVCVEFTRPDTETGVLFRGRSRQEFIPIGASESAAVKTGWLLLELTVRHELMEGFRWRGCRIFNPHHTIEELASLEREHKPY